MRYLLFLLYQLVLIILLPLALVLTMRDSRRRQGGKRFILQRLGMAHHSDRQGPIWFHAASLGEVNAIQPLLLRLSREQPNTAILVSTNTPSGAQAVGKLQLPGVMHAYLPIDYP